MSLMGSGETFVEAFGKVLGTAAICALVPFLISFLPHQVIKRVFPPIVSGVTIILIGINLTGVGIESWGGGAFCAQNYKVRLPEGGHVKRNSAAIWNTGPTPPMHGDCRASSSRRPPAPQPSHPCRASSSTPRRMHMTLSPIASATSPSTATAMATWYVQTPRHAELRVPWQFVSSVIRLCIVCLQFGCRCLQMLPYGHGVYVGLGFSVFAMIVILELFGSPFIRNCEVSEACLTPSPARSH